MKALHSILCTLLTIGLIFVIGCTEENLVTVEQDVELSAKPLKKVNDLPASLEQKVRLFRDELLEQGYQVAQGYWTLFSVEDCKYPVKTVGNCYGNNPTAPYILPVVPQWKDEFVDQKLHHAVMATQRNASVTFRMDEREALVILGVLPPPSRYLGLQSYVYSREGTIDTDDEIYQRINSLDTEMRDILFDITPNPSRVFVFSSIGNSINHAVIENQSGVAFNQERFIIITPDAVMERKVKEALEQSGVTDSDHIFTEEISTEVVRVGLERESDDLMTLMRYAMPVDETAGDLWRQQLPLVVLRVRDTNTTRATEPYPAAIYTPHDVISEIPLEGDLEQLKDAVKERWGQPAAPGGQFRSLSLFVDLLGQHCLDRPMNCLGDSQDADYRISPELTLDNGEVIALVGTLATATGNATYVSLSVNWWPLLMGVANISDEDLSGTASTYSDGSNAGKFYVYYVARDCTGLSSCYEVSKSILPEGESIKILQRAYMFPGSTVSANPDELLSPFAMVLDGTQRPSDL